jgi:hypothetical protein
MQRWKIVPTLLFLALVLVTPGIATAVDGLGAVLPDYEQIRQALVADSLAGVAAPAAALRETAESLEADLSAARAGVPAAKLSEVESLLPEVIEAARALETAESLDAARDAFYALSKPLVRWRQAADEGPAVAFCPMAKRSWLQPGDQEIRNPYLGKDMSTCGQIVSK